MTPRASHRHLAARNPWMSMQRALDVPMVVDLTLLLKEGERTRMAEVVAAREPPSREWTRLSAVANGAIAPRPAWLGLTLSFERKVSWTSKPARHVARYLFLW
eukprot:162649-Prymnesium_polylepis.1